MHITGAKKQTTEQLKRRKREVNKMTKKLIGINCYLYTARLDEAKQLERRKEIERKVFNATITERFINNGLAFESQRPKVKI